MKANIDRRGRWARAITGSLCIAAGIALFLAGWPMHGGYRWILVVFLLSAGLFQLFEAKRGWCVARACGLKTPL